MTPPFYWEEAKEYLTANDQVMAGLIVSYPDEAMINYHNPFYTLVKAIVGQQISVKAANAISQRLEKLVGNISPINYLTKDEVALRSCGLSRQKITYITNIAQAFENKIFTPENWNHMTDEEITKQLMAIKGIGPWTAQMFLIFHLHRSDILPLRDLGLIKAIQEHYGTEKSLNSEQIQELSQRWKPYRTVATWYLWRSLDPIPVQY
ncbi:MAG: DNA-3-methyladenine glycosylase [Crocosphaera sp.]|nr:DNA-3-methyladenine glycosylase [Crocosphaera sp.]